VSDGMRGVMKKLRLRGNKHHHSVPYNT